MTITVHIPTFSDLHTTVRNIFTSIQRRIVKLESNLFYRHGQTFWLLMFKLTKRCGSRVDGHTPIFGNKHDWLWKTHENSDYLYSECTICGEKIRTKKAKQEKNYEALAKKGRYEDASQLKEMYKRANDAERLAIRKSLDKINHEDTAKRAMRSELIKATRKHDHTEIKSIHEEVATKKKYRND